MTDIKYTLEFFEQSRFVVKPVGFPVDRMPGRGFQTALGRNFLPPALTPVSCYHTSDVSAGTGRNRLIQVVESLLETVRVRTLGLAQSFEPVGNLIETLVTGGLGHTRVHVGVFVCLAGN